MKAAVLQQLGDVPQYDHFEDPKPSAKGEELMTVHAVAIKNIDKLIAGGKHYASYKETPVVVGMDGVGTLEDGSRVYAKGKTGTLSEKAIVEKGDYIKLPDNLDWATAAAIPNAAMGSYFPLKMKADIKKGATVLINGGTGVTGKLAIQLARQYGAARIVVMGHIEGKEEELQALGADELIASDRADEDVIQKLKQVNNETPFHFVLDYLWGHPISLIIRSLAGGGGAYPDTFTKIISIGALSGDEISLSSNILRSAKIEITGAGLGSYTQEDFRRFNQVAIPEIFQWAAEGKLKLDIQVEKLEDIARVWNAKVSGKRLVVKIISSL